MICSRQEVTRPGQKWPGEVAKAVQQELEVPSSGWNSSDLVWGLGGGRWMVLTLWRRGAGQSSLRRIFPVFSGTSQDLPSFVLCATSKTAKMTAICCGRPNLSCSSLSTFQYNLCHSAGLPQEPLCCPPVAQMAVLFITSISYSLQIQHSSLQQLPLFPSDQLIPLPALQYTSGYSLSFLPAQFH